VASLCRKIAVMYAGKIVEYGTARDIFYDPMHEYTKGLLSSIPRLNETTHKRLVPIPGIPVDMLNIPDGCPFAPRCEGCMNICLREAPPVINGVHGHYASCWLVNKQLQFGEKEAVAVV